MRRGDDQDGAKRARRCAMRRPGGRLARRGGFSLLEVILAIALLTILVGVITAGMFGNVDRGYIEEGASQVETALRMARADAANQGRRLRLRVDEEAGRLIVEWEPQPLAQPNEFVAYGERVWVKSLPNDLVRVVRLRRTGASALDATTFGTRSNDTDDDELAPQAIEFHPDGSCDSALIELASRAEGDNRRAIIEMDGVNQMIATRLMTPTQLGEYYEQHDLQPTDGPNAY